MDVKELYTQLNNEDPAIRGEAINAAKIIQSKDKQLYLDFIQYAKKQDGGLKKLAELMTGTKYNDPDTSQVELPKIVQQKKEIPPPPPPPVIRKPKQRYKLSDILRKNNWSLTTNNCEIHKRSPALLLEKEGIQICIDCIIDIKEMWKEMNGE